MKNIILLILLIPMFCKAQSPDDHVVYPDTSLVIGLGSIIGTVDTGTYVHVIPIDDSLFITDIAPFSYKIMESSYDTTLIIDFKTIVTDILNQNKPAMKKFEYKIEFFDYLNKVKAEKILNDYGAKGWELAAFNDSRNLYIFKREIQEQ